MLRWVPGAQKYEDDLRDQWQSHAHREEWRRVLRDILDIHDRDACRSSCREEPPAVPHLTRAFD